jgi:hypothetical protein
VRERLGHMICNHPPNTPATRTRASSAPEVSMPRSRSRTSPPSSIACSPRASSRHRRRQRDGSHGWVRTSPCIPTNS